MRILLAVLTSSLLAAPAGAQVSWPAGKQAAIVLTYDDALPSQLDVAVPQLDAARLAGTFFLDGLTDDCDVARMLEEIASMNNVLFGIDGGTARTYSVPCSQMRVGGADYTEPLRRSGLVRFARTGGDQWNSVVTDPGTLDVFQVPSWGPVDGPDGAALIAYVERVRAARGLGVLQFHGVGGDYLAVSGQAHQALVDHLRKRPDVWVDTFQRVLEHVNTNRKAP